MLHHSSSFLISSILTHTPILNITSGHCHCCDFNILDIHRPFMFGQNPSSKKLFTPPLSTWQIPTWPCLPQHIWLVRDEALDPGRAKPEPFFGILLTGIRESVYVYPHCMPLYLLQCFSATPTEVYFGLFLWIPTHCIILGCFFTIGMSSKYSDPPTSKISQPLPSSIKG